MSKIEYFTCTVGKNVYKGCVCVYLGYDDGRGRRKFRTSCHLYRLIKHSEQHQGGRGSRFDCVILAVQSIAKFFFMYRLFFILQFLFVNLRHGLKVRGSNYFR